MTAHAHAHHRPRRAGRLVFAVIMLALLISAVLSGCSTGGPEAQPSTDQSPTGQASTGSDPVPTQSQSAEPEITSVKTKIARVIDGDTVAVEPVPGKLEENGRSPGEHVVRLLGIDAPEMNVSKDAEPECGAKAATDHLGGILPVGLPVVVEYDPVADRKDRYGRTLGYVITPALDDAGEQQVADGYAMPWHPESEPEPARESDYRMAAETAVSQRHGLHSQCASVGRG